jgi:hypothetical protein
MRALLVMTLLTTLGAPWARAIEPWETVLREQMRHELGCNIVAIGNVRQLELAGEAVIDGHAECEDGRSYDFTRPKPHMRFDFRVCQPVVC